MNLNLRMCNCDVMSCWLLLASLPALCRDPDWAHFWDILPQTDVQNYICLYQVLPLDVPQFAMWNICDYTFTNWTSWYLSSSARFSTRSVTYIQTHRSEPRYTRVGPMKKYYNPYPPKTKCQTNILSCMLDKTREPKEEKVLVCIFVVLWQNGFWHTCR